MDLTVFIPTRKRTNAQITHAELKRFSNVEPILVCPSDEQSTHEFYGRRVLVCPVIGIGPTRQFILERSPTRGVVMLDDDLYFSRRETPDQPRPLVKVSGKELDGMFRWISDQLDAGFVHGGVSARQGNQHVEWPYTDCIRVNNAHFFDRDVYLASGVRFDRLPVMEDFDVSLGLILQGRPNRVAYHYCWSQRGSGLKGGCSLYRTKEIQAAAAEQLHELYPDFVRVVTKTAISGGELFSGERTDVTISWLKAWESVCERDRRHSAPVQLKRHD